VNRRLCACIRRALLVTGINAVTIAAAAALAAEPSPLALDKVLDICFAPSFADAEKAAGKLGWDAMPPRQLSPFRIGLLINVAGNAKDHPVPADAEAADIVKAAGWRSPGASEDSQLVHVQSEYGMAAGLGCHLTESAKRPDLEPALIARLGAEPLFRGKAGNVTSIFWNGAIAAVLLSYSGAEGDTSYLSVSRKKPGK
jgi:hypothetical protein